MRQTYAANMLDRDAIYPATGKIKKINPYQESVVPFSKDKHFLEENTTAADFLFDRTMRSIETEFDKRSHFLNSAQLSSLEAAVRVMVAMANARADTTVSLSSLDPGVGKTTTYIQFTRNLVSMKEYAAVGILICLPRLDEVRRLVRELGLEPTLFAIKTSSPEVNALSATEIKDAQVVITTHEQVKRVSKRHPSFAEVDSLYYRGQPRKVRIWDEAYAPREVLQLSSDDISNLVSVLRSACPAVAAKLEDLKECLLTAPAGPFEVGEVMSDFAASLMADVRALVGERSANETTFRRLMDLEHSTARKAGDNTAVATLFSWSQVIPEDFAPALVFDASGRVRSTYTALEGNGDLCRLSATPKDYSTVDVHLYKVASSRTAWREQRLELVHYVAGIMKSQPAAKYLVIAHKDVGAKRLKPELERAASGVKFDVLRWGQHQGTNAFADYDHIIVASTFFIPQGAYEALAYASLGLDVSHSLPEGFLSELRQGELADMLLQGVCRGALRGCKDGKAVPSVVHILAATRSRVHELIPRLFPGCKIKLHEVGKPKATLAIKRAIDRCKELIAQSATFIPIADLMDACGISSRSNFNKQVVYKQSFQAYSEAAGLLTVEGQRPGSICGFKVPDFPPLEARDTSFMF